MATRFTLPRAFSVDANGAPGAGRKLYFYVAGTSTLQDTYNDANLATPNSNPVVAASDGTWPEIFLKDAAYKVVLKTSADVEVWTADNVLDGTIPIRTVATIAALKAITAAAAAAYGVVTVKGYTTTGDGGEGQFYWNSSSSSADNAGTIIQPDSAPATGRWIRLLFGQPVTVEMFGAKGDGTTDDATAINAAITAVSAGGGGVVLLKAATYLVGSTLLLPNGVILEGEGINATCIKLAAAADCDILKNTNFDALTGQNKWFTTDGVHHGFGLKRLRLDGNKANNAAGGGVKFYGKRYFIDEVMIVDSKGDAFVTEAGDVVGQNDWTDMPEAHIRALFIKQPDGNGFIYRGPHDGYIDSLFIAAPGQNGAVFEYSPGVHSGNCDINFIHSYAATLIGIDIQCYLKARHLIGESCYREGVVLNTGSYQAIIDHIESYNNDRNGTGTYYHVRLAGSRNVVNRINVRERYGSAGGILFSGDNNSVYEGSIWGRDYGNNAGSIGVEIAANGSTFVGEIWDWSNGIFGGDTAGIGLKTNSGAVRYNCKVDAKITACKTLWVNDVAGSSDKSSYTINGYCAATDTPFTATGALELYYNTYDVTLHQGPTAKTRSSNHNWATIPEAATYVDVAHGLFMHPSAAGISVTPNKNLGGRGFWIDNVGATSFRINVDSAAPVGGLLFVWTAKVGR